MTMLERVARALTVALVLPGTLACTGGGSDAVTGGETAGAFAGSFVTDEPTPGPQSVGVVEGQADGDLVRVAIEVTDTQDVFSAGFDAVFDPAAVEFVAWARGSLLEAGGESVLYTVSPQSDRVVVGVSRTSPAGGVDVVGSHDLIQLTFRVTRTGGSSLVLANGFLLDSQPPGPTAIAGVTWSGGSFVVR